MLYSFFHWGQGGTMETGYSDSDSIHTATITDVHHVPMEAIIRPIPPIIDEDKVKSLMETIKV